MTAYSTLLQLLERCGFEGEKETRYPLEILDELKIFQGIMTGNYATLRTDNAAKKLKHLVPQIEWTDEDIYQLRNQLAKALNLPGQEFNLNAFLPQAFFHDARHMAETRKEAIRAPIQQQSQKPTAKEPLERQQPRHPAQHNRQSPSRNVVNEEAAPLSNRNERPQPEFAEATEDLPVMRRPPQPTPTVEQREPAEPVISVRNLVEGRNAVRDDLADPRDKRRPGECDESKHRYFENFGGHLEEDIDAIKLALAMDKHRHDSTLKKAEQIVVTETEVDDADLIGKTPTKPRPDRQPINMNQNPPRKVPISTNANGAPSPNRTDRKRRFSRNNGQRNKVRRQPGPGVNR